MKYFTLILSGKRFELNHFKWTSILIFLCYSFQNLQAQDTLPKFSAVGRGSDKFIISWTNPFDSVSQISIQRSYDSIKNFKTILTVPDPLLKQNGFVDAKSPYVKPFYRLFVVLSDGNYFFTQSQRPRLEPLWVVEKPLPVIEKKDTVRIEKKPSEREVVISKEKDVSVKESKIPTIQNESIQAGAIATLKPFSDPGKIAPPPPPLKLYYVKKQDSIVAQLTEWEFPKFRDSIFKRTKDTLVFKYADTLFIKPMVPKEVYKISKFVYVDSDGNIAIQLLAAPQKTYSVKFYEEKGGALFEIKKVAEPFLILDKTNFLKAGWYRFELYEEGKLIEKNKFILSKEF